MKYPLRNCHKWLLIFLFISGSAFAQLCGGGIVRFYILTLNDSEPINFEYELFPASEKLFKEKVQDKIDTYSLDRYMDSYYSSGIEISEQTMKEIINPQDETFITQLEKYLEYSNLAKSGKVKNTLEFKTRELVEFPVILKISANDKSIYILGNFFGNCNRTSTLLWTDRFRWVR